MTRVAINPGHFRGADPGACAGGLREVDINLAVTDLLAPLLEAKGHEVRIIHSNELDDICAEANDFDADIFVSIHCNSAANPQANGAEFFYADGSSDGYRLAEYLRESYKNLGFTDRGLKTKSLYVVNNTNMPAVLIELGFISNEEDREKLNSSYWQNLMASRIAIGIEVYFA